VFKIRNYIDKEIPTLSEVRRAKRREDEIKQRKKEKELLLKAMDFYSENYPNSKHNHNWEKPKRKILLGDNDIQEELERLPEEDLFGIREILFYFDQERQIHMIQDHENRKRILARIGKLIPGYNYLSKLEGLYKKLRNTKNKIKVLEDRLEKDRKIFIERLKTKPPKKEIFECAICGKICGSPAGLKSHSRKHKNE